MAHEIFIRRASPDDLAEVIAIDEDACELYRQADIHLDFAPDHPFAVAERADWARAAHAGDVFLAGPAGAPPVGLLVMMRVDGAPYLEQLSVRMRAQKQGVGRRLLMRAIDWAPGEPLWLTTYAHLPWNRPFYERHGFAVVPEPECPPGMLAILEDQRRWLPRPEQRIAMRRAATS